VTWDDLPGASLDILELSEEYGLFSLQEAGVEPGELSGLTVVSTPSTAPPGPNSTAH